MWCTPGSPALNMRYLEHVQPESVLVHQLDSSGTCVATQSDTAAIRNLQAGPGTHFIYVVKTSAATA